MKNVLTAKIALIAGAVSLAQIVKVAVYAGTVEIASIARSVTTAQIAQIVNFVINVGVAKIALICMIKAARIDIMFKRIDKSLKNKNGVYPIVKLNCVAAIVKFFIKCHNAKQTNRYKVRM